MSFQTLGHWLPAWPALAATTAILLPLCAATATTTASLYAVLLSSRVASWPLHLCDVVGRLMPLLRAHGDAPPRTALSPP